MILKSATDDLQLVTSAAGDVDVLCEFADLAAAGTVTVDRDLTPAITTAATTEILPGVAANSRKVKHLMIRNVHASTTNTVTVLYNDNGTTSEEIKVTLLAGESIEYSDGKGWQYLDAGGSVKMSAQVPAATDTVAGILTTATQAEMEAAATVTAAVTPGRQNFHPGMTKAWLKCGVTANVLASHNITGVADTGAGAVTVTIATDFSSAHWSCSASIELASTVIAQSCTYDAPAAGTVILRSVVEAGSATDPVTWSMQACGDQ